MQKIVVKSASSTLKGVIGFDGEKLFVTRWIKR